MCLSCGLSATCTRLQPRVWRRHLPEADSDLVQVLFTVAESVHETVVAALASRQSLQQAVDALCNTTNSVCSASREEQVCQFLEASFSAVFPGCKAIPFGSCVSGLALADSDLDVFLDTGSTAELNATCTESCLIKRS